MQKFIFLLIGQLFLFIFVSCENTGNISATGPVAPNMKEIYQTKPNWTGRYLATLPCNNCDGLITMLQLNEDLSYTNRYCYSGKSSEIIEFKGTFEWKTEGEIFRIGDPVLGEKAVYYKIIPAGIMQLDYNAIEQTGDNAEQYKFSKLENDINNKYWELTEMMGVNINGPLNVKTPFIQFDNSLNKFEGQGFCNSFFGTYQLESSLKLKIGKVGSTRKSCPEIDQEKAMFQLLENAQFYKNSLDTLQIGKEDGIADLVFVFNPFKK